MATLDNDDLKAIKSLIEVTIDEVIESKLVTKEDISLLPTKDEFYKKMDEVVGELKTIRESNLCRASSFLIMTTELKKSRTTLECLQINLPVPPKLY